MRLSYLLVPCMIYTFFSACRVKGSENNTKIPGVILPVLQLQEKDTVLQQEYVADIQASRNVEIRAMAPGFIASILVDEGQEVKKGQPLFLLNDQEYQSALARASAALANTRAEARASELELKRVKLLVDKNIISKSEYELAEARLESARAKIAEALSLEENARIKLSYTHIRAPFDGIIDRIPLKQGSLVNEGVLLTTVSDLQAMYAYFTVSENEYLSFKKAQHKEAGQTHEIGLILSDGSAYPQKGNVETMESEFDKSTGSIAFRARFPNPEKILKHGATGRVSLTTVMDGALIIPQKSIFEIQDKNFVFVLDKNNTVRMKNIVPKRKFDKMIIVQSGLEVNDRIVCEGIQNIREGTTITPRMIGMDSLLSSHYSNQ